MWAIWQRGSLSVKKSLTFQSLSHVNFIYDFRRLEIKWPCYMDHLNGAFSVFCSLWTEYIKNLAISLYGKEQLGQRRKVQNRFRTSLTQTQRNFTAPGAVADTREDGGEGQFVSHQAAVAHAGAPVEHGALHLTVRHAGRRSTAHRWRDKHIRVH